MDTKMMVETEAKGGQWWLPSHYLQLGCHMHEETGQVMQAHVHLACLPASCDCHLLASGPLWPHG